jgi:hypothetical protein
MSQCVDFRALKQGLSIEQVLASYRIPLERVGHNQLRGPCPLPAHRSERSRGSFSVDTAKNVWACHSASCCEVRQGRVGGNVLDLVALLEGCTIRDAALRLQDRGCGWREGIHLREQQLASKGSSRSSSPDQLPRLTFSLSWRWHPYLEQRGVQRSTAARFGVATMAGLDSCGIGSCFRSTIARADWSPMQVAASMVASRDTCSRLASPSHRWSLIFIVPRRKLQSGPSWWKDSSTASESIRLVIATWWL